MGFIALVALLFFLRRRKKRQSLLAPFTTGTRTEFYRDEKTPGSAGFDQKYTSNLPPPNDRFGSVATGLKAGLLGLGTSLKSKVSRDRSNSPSVNLNRGNSQFLDGPIPTHSRNNSVLSGNGDKPTIKDRFTEWYDRVREDISWRMRMRKSNEPADPFAAARGLNEKHTKLNNPTPDFSQLLDMNDRELQLETERRRANFEKTQSGSSLPPLGSLGLSFSSMPDPFADPIKKNTGPNSSAAGRGQAARDPFADPIDQPNNPFSDPISQPQPSVSRPTTYVTDIRRSRGQSMDATNNGRPPSMTGGPTSRYPSSIAPSVDSYRDTVFSSFSNNARKGKGRSDPFDLERPELWQRTNNQNFNPRTSGRPRAPSISNIRTSNLNGYTAPLTVNNLQANSQPGYEPRVVSSAGGPRVSAGTYGSKYSSGVSSMTGWGDPGPDLGPGSGNTSMRGNASSTGGSTDFGRGMTPQRSDSMDSKSSRGGVGKAM
ncbi:hypothetical protein BJ875DRAFT_386035 [Amylocarpus encephaloides]|uniref:Uncharacterized protein n=1 Tax=Amylocarpus encephaloides TaxID=45428 RepID=A0A9P8C1K2_9HELO|nr:hypothetical protein BJ875DRAFT_386035 [Amylocarpus encephaloides]